jgi:hypothetical protein
MTNAAQDLLGFLLAVVMIGWEDWRCWPRGFGR